MQAVDAHVYFVILAGGSGTRFWPASRRSLPKQLLALGPTAPASLLQATAQRLAPLAAPDHIWVATGKHLLESTQLALPELSPSVFLAEPQAKNTAPCILWATALIQARDPEAIIVVVPSDQYAEDEAGFRACLHQAVQVAKQGHITTIGLRPTRPETGYGYIETGALASGGALEVERFVEKPDRPTAELYWRGGRHLWNAGMFVFSAQQMLDAFAQHLPALFHAVQPVVASFSQGQADYAQQVERFFEQAESISIDYGIMEKSSDLRVVPGDFGWSDLGSWESVWELSPKDAQGNSGEDSTVWIDAQGNLVHSWGGPDKKKIVALVGVEDLCVVDTEDALLILPRSRSQDVRLVVEALRERGAQEKI